MIIRLDTIECSYNNYEVILLEGDLFPLMFCEVVMKILGGHIIIIGGPDVLEVILHYENPWEVHLGTYFL